jgi:hypothetical protein
MQEFAQPDFGGGGDDRRKQSRKKKPFFIAYTDDKGAFVPAYALDIGRTGIRLLSELPVPDEGQVRVMIEKRDFIISVRKVWSTEVEREDKQWHMTGLRFSAIAPNDREFIDHYVAGKEYFEGSKLVEWLEELRKNPDSADRVLPQEILDRFHRQLVLKNRLVLRDNESPLVKYRYGGQLMRHGRRVHVMTIQSKIVEDGQTRPFVTKFVFDDKAISIEMLP